MDWNAVGAVGQWVGAVATFSAVVVALWQARVVRLATLPRIKVRAAHAITSTPDGMLDLVCFDAVNVGQRTVKLSTMELVLPDRRRLVMQQAMQELPRRLEEGEKVTIHTPTVELAGALQENGCDSEIHLRVCFRDSADNEFFADRKMDPTQWLGLKRKPA